MELPIFNDSLKSSGLWVAVIEGEKAAWGEALALRGGAVIEWMHRLQLDHLALLGHSVDDARLLEALRAVSGWAAGGSFDQGRLIEMHRILVGSGDDPIRRTEPLPLNPMHDPAPAVLVPRLLDNAFDWFGTQSFSELHPVEQASVVYLRLLDLHPFTSHMDLTALLAAGFYTQRAGLPSLVIYREASDRYRQAVEAAFRMLTQPLVELFAEMLARSMRDSLQDEP